MKHSHSLIRKVETEDGLVTVYRTTRAFFESMEDHQKTMYLEYAGVPAIPTKEILAIFPPPQKKSSNALHNLVQKKLIHLSPNKKYAYLLTNLFEDEI